MKAVKILTIFNNKGGVGKTTLTFHLAHALASIGKRVLAIDLDPQCNLTIYSLDEEKIADIWTEEDPFIDDFQAARKSLRESAYNKLLSEHRSIHFILKPIEDGTGELNVLPPPISLADNLDLIPGRLTLHLFEGKVSERFSAIYTGDPLAIRTATSIRTIAGQYAKENKYDIVLVDTSPSLGALNRNILSQADGFLVPANPDLFSLYGIRNIGAALKTWKKQLQSVYVLLSDAKRHNFPEQFVKFIGYTLYNSKRLQGSKSTNKLGIATAHYNYAKQIPQTIFSYLEREDMVDLPDSVLKESIGKGAVIHGHNTLPSMAQTYHLPMWKLPSYADLQSDHATTIRGNRKIYENTAQQYARFARDVVRRLEAM